MMKVFGGVMCFKGHPCADMHGLLRATVRTASQIQARSIVECYTGISLAPSLWIAGIWGESFSVHEQQVTEGHPGKVFVCRLTLAYLSPDDYQVLTPIRKGKS